MERLVTINHDTDELLCNAEGETTGCGGADTFCPECGVDVPTRYSAGRAYLTHALLCRECGAVLGSEGI